MVTDGGAPRSSPHHPTSGYFVRSAPQDADGWTQMATARARCEPRWGCVCAESIHVTILRDQAGVYFKFTVLITN